MMNDLYNETTTTSMHITFRYDFAAHVYLLSILAARGQLFGSVSGVRTQAL